MYPICAVSKILELYITATYSCMTLSVGRVCACYIKVWLYYTLQYLFVWIYHFIRNLYLVHKTHVSHIHSKSQCKIYVFYIFNQCRFVWNGLTINSSSKGQPLHNPHLTIHPSTHIKKTNNDQDQHIFFNLDNVNSFSSIHKFKNRYVELHCNQTSQKILDIF